jgi:DNA processing protein
MRDWVALNMTPGIGPRMAARLLEKFGSPENVFRAARSELESLRLRPESVDSILAKSRFNNAEEELLKVQELGCEILVLDDGLYPTLLREIADPPIVLYVKGDWRAALERPTIAIVGSRRCSTYGQNASTMLARDLAERGITIVSGLARGCDASAHKGALDVKGVTVPVIGTGIDEVYPRDHKRLVSQLLETSGAVVSEFPLGTPPSSQNFPYRNRVISGLSLGVVIVEASEFSGSLITARLALEQGRELFAVPGNITSKNSFGTNFLIKGGAKLVQQWQDIVSEFYDLSSLLSIDRSIEAGPELNENEKRVLRKLKTDEAVQIDNLVETTSLRISEVTNVLFSLEMKDLITELPGKSFVKKL